MSAKSCDGFGPEGVRSLALKAKLRAHLSLGL
jgi:hypothetical protein